MKPPCIRGLKEFKKGCPQRCWNGNDGCPAWMEEIIVENGKKKNHGACLEWWKLFYARNALRLLEGTQQATESNRNMTALHSLVAVNARTPEDLFRVATKNLEQSRDKLLLEAKGQDGDS